MAGSGYDYDVSTLSPEGKIYQVDYATKASENSSTIVGIICKDGVLLGTEKVVLSEMTVPGSDHRIYSITKQIGMVLTGMIPDGRALVERAREESASFHKQYGIPITGKVLAERLGDYIHMNTIHLWARPFGCTLILASFDETNGPALHMIDASGQCFGYYGCAAGKSRQMARNEIDKMGPKNLTCKDVAFNLAKILYKAHEEMKEKKFELEISWIAPDTGMTHQLIPKETVKEMELQAQEAVEKEAMADVQQ